MSVSVAIIGAAMSVTLWCMDSAAALKCNSYGLESLLAVHLGKGSVYLYTREGTWYVNM